MRNIMKKRIPGAILGAIVAPLLILTFKSAIYSVLPFDWFVDIETFEAQDMVFGDLDHQILMNRAVRFDTRASATKEVYKIDQDGSNQTIHTNFKQSFIFEKESNDTNFTLNVRYSDLPIPCGKYKTLDYIEIYPSFGVSKNKVVKTNIWEVTCDNI